MTRLPAGGPAALAGVGEKRLDIGLHRTVAPTATMDDLWPRRAAFGITRIANVTGLDRIGIPVTLAIRPNARSVAVSQGKGRDLAAARASGFMEAAELWHAENAHLPAVFGTFDRLAESLEMVDIDALPAVERVARSGHEPCLWVEGTDLATGGSVHVPLGMVHADYAHPVAPGHDLFPASTNGLASGNHPLEAVCHGLYEVVERDAVSLFHAMPVARRTDRRVDPSTVTGNAALLLDLFEAAGTPLAIWDVTSDLGVATFFVALHGPGHVGIGAGTHLDRDAALSRALTEAAQTRMTYITGSRDDLTAAEFDEGRMAEKSDAVARLVGEGPPVRNFGDTPDTINATLRADLDTVLARFAASRLPAPIAVDLSRADIPMSVFRIIAPGLEAPHDDPGYMPGPRARRAGEGGP